MLFFGVLPFLNDPGRIERDDDIRFGFPAKAASTDNLLFMSICESIIDDFLDVDETYPEENDERESEARELFPKKQK